MGILVEPWPDDLDPITVLKGMRLWDDMTRIDHRFGDLLPDADATVHDIAHYGLAR